MCRSKPLSSSVGRVSYLRGNGLHEDILAPLVVAALELERLTVTDVSSALGVSRQTIYQWAVLWRARGLVPADYMTSREPLYPGDVVFYDAHDTPVLIATASQVTGRSNLLHRAWEGELARDEIQSLIDLYNVFRASPKQNT